MHKTATISPIYLSLQEAFRMPHKQERSVIRAALKCKQRYFGRVERFVLMGMFQYFDFVAIWVCNEGHSFARFEFFAPVARP